jgi:hypothetical protein
LGDDVHVVLEEAQRYQRYQRVKSKAVSFCKNISLLEILRILLNFDENTEMNSVDILYLHEGRKAFDHRRLYAFEDINE